MKIVSLCVALIATVFLSIFPIPVVADGVGWKWIEPYNNGCRCASLDGSLCTYFQTRSHNRAMLVTGKCASQTTEGGQTVMQVGAARGRRGELITLPSRSICDLPGRNCKTNTTSP